MTRRREALLGRFRSGTLERLRRISTYLDDLEHGGLDSSKVQAIARELHTLKGESRMLGLTKISAVAHSTEELLLTAQRTQAIPSHEERALVRHVLEAVSRSLRGETPGEGSGGAALEAMIDQIGETTSKPEIRSGSSFPPDEPTHQRPTRQKMRRADRVQRRADTSSHGLRRRAGGPLGRLGLVLGSGDRRSGVREQWVRVSASQLTDLSDLCATLASDFRALRARLQWRREVDADHDGTAGAPSPSEQPTLTGGSISDHVAKCAAALDTLVAHAWALRLVPVEPMFGELAEHALEMAAAQHKKLKVITEGADLKLERRLLDQLWDPLVHLVRNAIDHGIEPLEQRGDKPAEALLTIRAESTGNHIVLTVSDDGRGIRADTVRAAAVRCGLVEAADAETLGDEQALKLVFQHGFTTRAQAGDWSGRGVGLDVVRTVAHELGGSIGVETDPGYGTTFSLYLPATLSKDRVVVFECERELFAVPSRHVQRFTRLDAEEARADVLRAEAYADPIPLLSWTGLLGRKPRTEDEWAIVLEAGGRTWGIGLPNPPFETELLLRPAAPAASTSGPARTGAKHAPPSSGAQSRAPWIPPVAAEGVLDDGRVVRLLSVSDLLSRLQQAAPKRP